MTQRLPLRASLTVEIKRDRNKLNDCMLIEELVRVANAEGGEHECATNPKLCIQNRKNCLNA